jgi:hypothetical protein
MPDWAVEQIRVLISPNSEIVMFITAAIDFVVQPKGQSRSPKESRTKKPKIRSRACSISSHLAVGLFNESMPITERPRQQAPPTASIRSLSLGGAPSGVVLYLNIHEIAGARGLRRSQRAVSVSVGTIEASGAGCWVHWRLHREVRLLSQTGAG